MFKPTMGFEPFNLLYQLIRCNDAVENKLCWLYFFITGQTAQVAQPMVFQWARQLRQSAQQQRNTNNVYDCVLMVKESVGAIHSDDQSV